MQYEYDCYLNPNEETIRLNSQTPLSKGDEIRVKSSCFVITDVIHSFNDDWDFELKNMEGFDSNNIVRIRANVIE